MATVKEAVCELLRTYGLTTIFGNPGSSELPILADLPEECRFILALQESAAVAMADGYTQFSDRAAMVVLHSAPGLGHAMGSVYNAWHNRSPLLLLVGQQHRRLLTGDPFVGMRDEQLMPRPYVKDVYEAAEPADVPAMFSRAYHRAVTSPRGPVVLVVPVNDWAAQARPVQPRPVTTGRHPQPEVVRELIAALADAANPAIIAGAEVDRDKAVPHLVRLAQATGASVWQAPMSGRCSFPETHPRFAGHLPADPHRLQKVLDDHGYDLVVGLGKVDSYHTYTGTGSPAIDWIVDDDEDVLARTPGIPVHASVGAVLRTAADTVDEAGSAAAPPANPRMVQPPAMTSPVTAAHVYHTISVELPDAIVVEEAPAHRRALQTYLPISAPDGGGYLTAAAGCLGYGIAAAVGVALARQDRTVVSVVGDGSAMYTIQALWTAAQHRTKVIWVVLDNGGYAIMRTTARQTGLENVAGLDMSGIDWVALAEGLGVPASTITADRPDSFPEALKEAATRPGPALIHLPVTDSD